jgi:hypothetical protein
MIKTEFISPNALKIVPSGKVMADDFRQLAPQVEPIIRQNGRIRLLIDASEFDGWENFAAFETHANFIKDHQKSVERLALIAGHNWQHWLVDVIRMFLHPEARAFDKSHEGEAYQWIVGR